jgi:hypothetical protein
MYLHFVKYSKLHLCNFVFCTSFEFCFIWNCILYRQLMFLHKSQIWLHMYNSSSFTSLSTCKETKQLEVTIKAFELQDVHYNTCTIILQGNVPQTFLSQRITSSFCIEFFSFVKEERFARWRWYQWWIVVRRSNQHTNRSVTQRTGMLEHG